MGVMGGAYGNIDLFVQVVSVDLCCCCIRVAYQSINNGRSLRSWEIEPGKWAFLGVTYSSWWWPLEGRLHVELNVVIEAVGNVWLEYTRNENTVLSRFHLQKVSSPYKCLITHSLLILIVIWIVFHKQCCHWSCPPPVTRFENAIRRCTEIIIIIIMISFIGDTQTMNFPRRPARSRGSQGTQAKMHFSTGQLHKKRIITQGPADTDGDPM